MVGLHVSAETRRSVRDFVVAGIVVTGGDHAPTRRDGRPVIADSAATLERLHERFAPLLEER